MTKLFPSDKIYISRSKIKGAGRGVFAGHAIKSGELIESCPVIEIPEKDHSLLVESVLVSYFYFLGKKKGKAVVTLGFGSLYNHSFSPNAIYQERLKEGAMDFIAVRQIKKGEEITVNYDPEQVSGKSTLWFKVAR